MKAIVSDDYGTYHNLKLVDFIKPAEIPKGKMLIKTEAVSLAPGDVRVLSGACKELQGPPSFPYIPGGDLCGIIEDMNDVNPSKVGYGVGDRIAARFTEGPRGALAEYTIVSPKMTDQVPANLSSVDAAALASSGTIALHLSRRISNDEKCLVIGAGGGVGSHLIQLLKLKGVKFVAAATHDVDRILKLGCEIALNYETTDIYEFEEWQKVGVAEKFDTVVDLSGGSWLRFLEQSKMSKDAREKHMIVKPASQGGRYLTLVPDVYDFEIHSVWQGMKLFLFQNSYRAFYSRFFSRTRLPGHTFAMSLENDVDIMKETLSLASEQKLMACVDDRGPFDFTTEGVKDAFKLQESRNARGKVVVLVSKGKDTNPHLSGESNS